MLLPSSTLPAVVKRAGVSRLRNSPRAFSSPWSLPGRGRSRGSRARERRNAIISSMIFGRVSASERMAPVQGVQPSERMRHITICGLLAGQQRDILFQRESTTRPAPPSAAAWRNTAERWECSPRECSARRPARSSWRAEKRGCSRPCRCGRCRDSTVRAAGSWDPTGRRNRGTNRPAPWRGTSPRRGARRRRPRRSRPPPAHPAGPGSSAGRSTSACPGGTGWRRPRSPRVLVWTISRAPISAQKRSRNSIISRNL